MPTSRRNGPTIQNSKMVLSSLLLLGSLLIPFSCTKENHEETLPDSREVILEIGTETRNASPFDTRAGFDEKGKFYWSAGDQIGVMTNSGTDRFEQMTLIEGAGNAEAKFRGNLSGELNKYAVYPYRTEHFKIDESRIRYYFPSSYTYAHVDSSFFATEKGTGNSFNPPMWADLNSEKVRMKHLGGVFCIYIEELPIDDRVHSSGLSSFISLTTDKKINGFHTVDLSTETPSIMALQTDQKKGRTVTLYFHNTKKGRSGVFYIPAPVGTYEKVTIEISDGYVIQETFELGPQTLHRQALKKLMISNGTGTTDGPEIIEDWANKTFWVHGIQNPPFEQWGLSSTIPYQAPGLTWDRSYGWYDCNKKDPSGPSEKDNNLCWAATASNLIYWWIDQNRENIERYGKYKGPHTYNSSTDCDVFQFFKDHFKNEGNKTVAGLNWFFRGTKPAEGLLSSSQHKGFFTDVFSGTMIRSGTGWTLDQDLKTAFQNKEAIGMSMAQMGGYHAITVWGASFDENGQVCTLYVVDNNDIDAESLGSRPMQPGKLCPFGIYPLEVRKNAQGEYRLQNSTGQFTTEINALEYLGTKDKEWAEYFKKKPV